MRDFLPEDVARRQHVVSVIRNVYEAYGFVPIETPAVENLSTLLGKYGEEGDQLIFRILHRRDALKRALAREHPGELDLGDLALRYDLTVPLARVIAEHRELPRYFKRYQVQPVWRADRPGRGRFREFFQCDVDIMGTSSLVAEAEVCGAVAEVLGKLGFREFTLRLNHRGLLRSLVQTTGIPIELEGVALVAIDKLDKIGREGVAAELRQRGVPEAGIVGISPIFDAVADDQAHVRERVRVLLQQGSASAGLAALEELERLESLLCATPAVNRVRFDPTLARGLGYYTGPIFEVSVPDLAGSLGGGGRYDGLIGMFGKHMIPAVGFSLGLERILVVMEERGMFPPLSTGPDMLLCWIGSQALLERVLEVASILRGQLLGARRLRVEVFPEPAKLGKQLEYAANHTKTAFTGIVGEDELGAGHVVVRNLASSEQRSVLLGDVAATIASWSAVR